jgi:hypothetical protein
MYDTDVLMTFESVVDIKSLGNQIAALASVSLHMS